MQAKIWDGQFVDLAQQLSKSFIEKKNEEKQVEFFQDEQGWLVPRLGRKQKGEMSIDLWTSAFHVLMSIYLVAHPDSLWWHYNQQFQVMLAGRPGLQMDGLRDLELEACGRFIRVGYPYKKVVWSDMLPLRSWRYNESQVGAEKSRNRNQFRLDIWFCQKGRGGAVIKHPTIRDDWVSLLADGVHLSAQGMEVFITSLVNNLLSLIVGC